MLQELKMFTIKCDICGKIFEDKHQGIIAWDSEKSAWDNAQDSGWAKDADKHCCPNCI